MSRRTSLLPHAAFGVLFLGLVGFGLTGDFALRNAVQVCAVALLAAQTVRRKDARVAWALLTVANAAWAIGDLNLAR